MWMKMLCLTLRSYIQSYLACAHREKAAAGEMADIIGLSCRFPESNGPEEFWNNLMDGTDMVTCDDRRWPVGFQGLPPRSGKLPGFDKFDAAFFSVHGKQAQVRKERSYLHPK
jgi:fatty acid synthase